MELNAVNENFEVIYLPPNVTAVVQPMDQGAISLTKKHYKKNLLRRALFDYGGTTEYLKNINIQECSILLKSAWDSLADSTLNKMWKALLGNSCVINENHSVSDQVRNTDVFHSNISDEESLEICNQLSQVLEQSENTFENSNSRLVEWLQNDDSDCGWEPLSDDGIISMVTNERVEENISNNEEDENSLEGFSSHEISAAEAFEGLKNFKSWMLSSNEFPQYHASIQDLENLMRSKVENPPVN